MAKIRKQNRRSFKNSIKYLKKEEWDKPIVTRSGPQGAAGNAKTGRGVQIGKPAKMSVFFRLSQYCKLSLDLVPADVC